MMTLLHRQIYESALRNTERRYTALTADRINGSTYTIVHCHKIVTTLFRYNSDVHFYPTIW